MVKNIYCFDIDETICRTDGLDYALAVPILNRIKKINFLYDNGHTIKFYTARGTKTNIVWTDETVMQLNNWGVKYHELSFGKPFADFYVDDKAINDKDFDWKIH